jgi:hypothetical protein
MIACFTSCGDAARKEIEDLPRIIATYGGTARDWAKISRHLGDRHPLFQPPDGGQLKFLRELPA